MQFVPVQFIQRSTFGASTLLPRRVDELQCPVSMNSRIFSLSCTFPPWSWFRG